MSLTIVLRATQAVAIGAAVVWQYAGEIDAAILLLVWAILAGVCINEREMDRLRDRRER